MSTKDLLKLIAALQEEVGKIKTAQISLEEQVKYRKATNINAEAEVKEKD